MASTPPAAAASGFSVDVAEQGDQVVVAVVGELDVLTAPVLERHLSSAVVERHDRVVVDLGAVTFLDVRAVNMLHAADARVRSGGARLVLRRPSAKLRRVIELCEVDLLIET
jgi:anti-sigma B factor antagonist